MKEESYKNIFKTTFLFGFVQVFNILVKVVINKIVAVVLGADGMGIIGIYNNTIGLIKSGAGLGISQSAVRDISEANAEQDRIKFSKTISVTNQAILFTGLLGAVVTLILSPWLSEWTMGNRSYTYAFIWLALVVAVNVLTDGQLAILKGMRQLQALAKASMLGAVTGLVAAVPMYYLFGLDGIIPSLIICSVGALFFSNFYVKKIRYDRVSLSIKEIFEAASPMIKMGIALMFTSFLLSVVTLAISAYMRSQGGLSDVGYYNAGVMILQGYFGIIITAISTDYFPRIAAVNRNNVLLQEELNKQSAVSLVLCCPLIVIFLFLLPVFIRVLYSAEFLPTINFIRVGIFGTLVTICSNQMDMILVAKFKMKLFVIVAIIYSGIQLSVNIVLYKYYGLIGAGISLTVMGVVHMIIMATCVYKLYGITFNKVFMKIAGVVFSLFIITTFVCALENELIKYSMGIVLIMSSCFYSLFISKKYFDIDFFQYLYNIIRRK